MSEKLLNRNGNGPSPQDSTDERDSFTVSPYAYSVRHKSVSSWVSSVGIHSMVLAILLLMLWQIPKGVGDEQVVTGSIVLVADSDDQNDKVYLDQSDVESNEEAEDAAASAAAAQAVASQTPTAMEDLPDLPGRNVAEDSAAQATSQQQAMTGVGEMTIPTTQTGGGKIGQRAVKFGGVTGTGSKFVYVVDRSASMGNSNARLMKAAKAELEISLRSLTETQQFQVIFYNDEWQAFQREQGPLRLYEGTEANVDQALNYIQGVSQGGGTEHLQPMLTALRLGADVVFLLTDADTGLSRKDFNEIERANRSGAVICVIVYGETLYPTVANESFHQLSKSTNGTFKFKSVNSVGR